MGFRRRVRSRRRLRRLVMLGGSVSGIAALRTVLLARNEKRFADVIADPSSDQRQ
jgi:hypothetical protein